MKQKTFEWWQYKQNAAELQSELRMIRSKTIYRPQFKWAVNHFILSKDFILEWTNESEQFRSDFEKYMTLLFTTYMINQRNAILFKNLCTYVQDCNPTNQMKQFFKNIVEINKKHRNIQ